MTHKLRYAVGSDPGLLRPVNEDSAYTSPRLLAVADGMGGHAHGEVASSVAIAAMSDLDARLRGVNVDLLGALSNGFADASRRLQDRAARDESLWGMGTTLTAMLWDGGRFAVAHIGDSRAYLLRGGMLHQLTHDHTMVQALVDGGRMPPEQAAEHPRRSVLMRALQSNGEGEPDLFFVDAYPHDRYLICSDGLTDYVGATDVHEVLTTHAEPQIVVRRLIELANQAGGPDNITCVVADVLSPSPSFPEPRTA